MIIRNASTGAAILALILGGCVPPPDPPATSARRAKPTIVTASLQRPAPQGQRSQGQPLQRQVLPKPNFIPVPTIAAPPPSRAPQGLAVDYRIAPPPALFATLTSLAARFPGRVGIAVTRADATWMFNHQASTPYPQQSVSKLWVALTVLDGVDRGKIALDQAVTIKPADLTLFHQPIARLVSDTGYTTTVADLLQRAMTQSDNTANDRLLKLIGGPSEVNALLAQKGIGGVRFGPGERLLQSKAAGLTWRQELSRGGAFFTARNKVPLLQRSAALNDYLASPPDGAAPQAIARALARLVRGELLSPASTRYLISQMNEATTGKMRVAGGVPYGWRYGHKTGTGQQLAGRSTGYNDVGILTAPDGTTYTLAVMIAETASGIPTRQVMMQGVAAAIVANHRP